MKPEYILAAAALMACSLAIYAALLVIIKIRARRRLVDSLKRSLDGRRKIRALAERLKRVELKGQLDDHELKEVEEEITEAIDDHLDEFGKIQRRSLEMGLHQRSRSGRRAYVRGILEKLGGEPPQRTGPPTASLKW